VVDTDQFWSIGDWAFDLAQEKLGPDRVTGVQKAIAVPTERLGIETREHDKPVGRRPGPLKQLSTSVQQTVVVEIDPRDQQVWGV